MSDLLQQIRGMAVDGAFTNIGPYVHLAYLERVLADAARDSARLDWLADRNNPIGQVLLPAACVEANLFDMRAAIDAAMAMPTATPGEGE